MAGLEELMAGLFGELQAAGLDETRRRRNAPGAGGYDGIGGAAVTPGQMLPYYGGVGQWDYSGAMGSRMGGREGLMALLGGRDLSGPAMRHFANQGFDFNPPGQDNRNGPGGPNIAPGNIDNAQALDQPRGNLTPGVPRGVGFGVEPGRVGPIPQTQGWRNVHPGYSAAAQFGTDPSGRPLGFGGIGRSAPAAASAPPAAVSGGGVGGGRGAGAGGGGGGGAGGAPQSQNPIGGGVSNVAPAGPRGGGGGGTGGGQASGGKNTGGGGGQATARGGSPGPIGVTQGGQLGINDQGEFSQPLFKREARGVRRAAVDRAIAQSRGGGPTSPDAGSGLFYDTIHVVPNQGNNNTPSEMRGGGGGDRWSDTHEARYANETNAEKKARLAAKAARQEAARLRAAPSASNFGNRAQGGLDPIIPVLNAPLSQQALESSDPRGSGTKPLKGKTKPKSSTSKQQL